MFTTFIAPIAGRLLALEKVPDQVFAQKIMGEGFAIDPTDGEVVSPINGTVTAFPADTRHAVGITAADGLEVLIHIGIDTVDLGGEGFSAFIQQGDLVKAGQTLLKVDLDFINSKNISVISPVVFTNLPEGMLIRVEEGRHLKIGETGFLHFG